jgi:hypothetical protein
MCQPETTGSSFVSILLKVLSNASLFLIGVGGLSLDSECSILIADPYPSSTFYKRLKSVMMVL